MAIARTKLEKEVTRLSEELLDVTQSQKDWIHKNSLNHKGFATKTRVICMDCGETFSPKIVKRKKAVCPCCNTKLKVEITRCRTDYQSTFNAVAMTYKGYQVIRYINTYANYAKGKKATYSTNKVIEFWINSKDKITMIGNLRSVGWVGERWSGDWSIRKNYGHHYKYNLYTNYYLPGSRFLKKYTKIGINRHLKGLTFSQAISLVRKYSEAETLLKAKEYELLYYMKNYTSETIRYWSSIKLALKHKYKLKLKDVGLWIDYLGYLEFFDKDLRSPKYLFVDNIKKEHNKYYKKLEKIKKEKEKQRRIADLESREPSYLEKNKPYIGLSFKKNEVEISFLNTVKEVFEEGEALKHCVWQREYYKKNTLLFSAQINGVKISTIEVDPKQLKVIQVRGYNNQVTDHDERFIKIMTQNLSKIAKRKNTKKTSRKQQVTA